MSLDERITTAIRSHVDDVPPWAPDLDSIRRTARDQARRQATVVVSGVAAAVVVVVTAVGLGGGLEDRSTPPVDRPDGGLVRVDEDGVVVIPRVREDDVVVTPEVQSTVSPGPRLVESVSSDDTSYDGSGELAVVLKDGADYSSLVATCDAAAAFLVVTVEPNEAYFDWGRCNGQGVSLSDLGREPQDRTLSVYVTEEDPRPARRCWLVGTPEGCAELMPSVATGSEASFRLEVYREQTGPVAVRMFDEEVYARGHWEDTLYSLTTVAAGATGASELTFRVGASDRPRIAWATFGTPALQRCYAQAEREQCVPTVEVSLDGQPFEEPDIWPYGIQRGWGRLTPGEDHVITMRVVEGDPDNIDLGFWIYEED